MEGKMEKVVPDTEELPRAIVRRVVKDKLSRCSDDVDIAINKDALLAFSESARIFIHYLSATANDLRESKRQTINADDVLNALEEIEFLEFIRPLKSSLKEFRQKNAVKKAGATKEKEVTKRRKTEETSHQNGGKSKQDNGDEDTDEED